MLSSRGGFGLRRVSATTRSFLNRKETREIFGGGDRGGDGQLRRLRSLREGRYGGGSKTELEQIGYPANETVGRDAGSVSRRILSKTVAGEKGSVRKCRGAVRENRLCGEESPD